MALVIAATLRVVREERIAEGAVAIGTKGIIAHVGLRRVLCFTVMSGIVPETKAKSAAKSGVEMRTVPIRE
jgi:hypothetical protein